KKAEDAKVRRYAENALSAAERGARLTGQLLAFSRVQRLEVQPTYVAPLIEAMSPLLRNVLGPGIEKRFDLDEAMIPVMADPTQLEVAVLNLAINARDAMPEGGMLSFSSLLVHIENDPELEDGDYIEVTISDTGSGMAPDVLERAFEPFFTTKEVGKGTGLGLSMVYGMARQSGGAARIESQPGQGTAVKLLFRKADGREGLKELTRQTPDLVVLDFIMPGLSGAEVANRILARRPDQPILFVSGYSETEAVKRIAPHAPLLTKPFRAEALERAVRGVLAAKT